MLKNFSDHKIIQKSFGWIKKNLDPLRSYIILENDLTKEKNSIFSDDIIAYKYLKKENYSWQKVIDTDFSREYLVIQIAPGSEDKIFAKVMGCGFPRNTVYYLFKAPKN